MAAQFCTNCGRPLTETERQFRLTTCAACAASAGATPPTPAEQGTIPSQPPPGETSVNLRIEYPERLSRWLLFVKWLFVIPAFIVLFLYGIAVFVTTFISFWAILFTGRYPSGLFNFARGFMALQARTYAYFPLLLTEQYPLASRLETEEQVRYEVEQPERLSRWLLLLKLGSFLLSVVGTLTGIMALVLVIAAMPIWFAILFTGRYPRGMFDFMVAVAQWIARVTGWQYLMRDEWSLFATTQGVGVTVGAAALAATVLTIVNYATGGFGFEFETGEDQNGVRSIQDLMATQVAMTEGQPGEAATPLTTAEEEKETPTPAPAPEEEEEEAAAPEVAPATKTFSKYGLSFEYPKEFPVTEVGLLENEANETSGLVQVGVENEQVRFFTLSWIKTVTLIGDYLQDSLDGAFAGMAGTPGIDVDSGELAETQKAGQRVLYQYYTATDVLGDEVHGIVAAFYCDESQRLFSLLTTTNTTSAKEDILQEFETYLDSLAC